MMRRWCWEGDGHGRSHGEDRNRRMPAGGSWTARPSGCLRRSRGHRPPGALCLFGAPGRGRARLRAGPPRRAPRTGGTRGDHHEVAVRPSISLEFASARGFPPAPTPRAGPRHRRDLGPGAHLTLLRRTAMARSGSTTRHLPTRSGSRWRRRPGPGAGGGRAALGAAARTERRGTDEIRYGRSVERGEVLPPPDGRTRRRGAPEAGCAVRLRPSLRDRRGARRSPPSEEGVCRVNGLPPHVRATVHHGTFDGVHLGHQAILRRVRRRARARNGHAVLLTFDPHPLSVVRPEVAPPLLTLPDEKKEVLAQLGLRLRRVRLFHARVLPLLSRAVRGGLIVPRFRPAEVVIGYDHGFGRGRAGDVSVLERLGATHGFGVSVVGASKRTDRPYRRPGSAGGGVGRHGGRGRGPGPPIFVPGTVIRGLGRGRTLGFRPPTSRLRVSKNSFRRKASTPCAPRSAPNGPMDCCTSAPGRPLRTPLRPSNSSSSTSSVTSTGAGDRRRPPPAARGGGRSSRETISPRRCAGTSRTAWNTSGKRADEGQLTVAARHPWFIALVVCAECRHRPPPSRSARSRTKPANARLNSGKSSVSVPRRPRNDRKRPEITRTATPLHGGERGEPWTTPRIRCGRRVPGDLGGNGDGPGEYRVPGRMRPGPRQPAGSSIS